MISATEPHGAFMSVNGLRMYVAEQGEGDPLVLVHGAIVDSGVDDRDAFVPVEDVLAM
jgi:hypothetical protein